LKLAKYILTDRNRCGWSFMFVQIFIELYSR